MLRRGSVAALLCSSLAVPIEVHPLQANGAGSVGQLRPHKRRGIAPSPSPPPPAVPPSPSPPPPSGDTTLLGSSTSYDGYKECQPVSAGEAYWLCTDDGYNRILSCVVDGANFDCYDETSLLQDAVSAPNGVGVDYTNKYAYVSTSGDSPNQLIRFSESGDVTQVELSSEIGSAKKLLVAPSGEWMVVLDQGSYAWYLPDLLTNFTDNMPVYGLANWSKIHGASWVTLANASDTITVNDYTISATHMLTANDGSVRYVSDQAFVTGGSSVDNKRHGPLGIVVSNSAVRSAAIGGDAAATDYPDCACSASDDSEGMATCQGSATCTLIYWADEKDWYSVVYSRNGSTIVAATKMTKCQVDYFAAPTGIVDDTEDQDLIKIANCGSIFSSDADVLHGAAISISGSTYIASMPHNDGGGWHGLLNFTDDIAKDATKLVTSVGSSSVTVATMLSSINNCVTEL